MTLNLIKSEFPFIDEVHLGSNGAGNFKCKEAFLSMPLMLKLTGNPRPHTLHPKPYILNPKP